jgi:mono/diheme cytochrome c family protein
VRLAVLALLGAIVAWVASAPRPLTQAALPQHQADAKNGELMYNIGGCRSCHKPGPELANVDAALPAGSTPLKTPIGVLYPPNITPDPETGIGKWSDLDFVNAVQRGISPDGRHYIPAFPYTSYAHMRTEDVLDIKAYLATLTPVNSPHKPHGIPAQFVIRRGLGLWKYLGLDTSPIAVDPNQTAGWNRGRYLVDGPGHCGECHTPRTVFMTSDISRYMAGGPHPEGEGKVPSLLDLIGRKRYKDAKDLATALQYGETFGYDKLSSGGMGAVQTNISKLPEADIAAIAEYLSTLK